ncbi:MAG: hypothetical protein IJ272_04905 [Clostridia bacterium]|nr:hypothetical protein [Clostridia bacterium]
MKNSVCSYEKSKACSNAKCPMWANYCPVPDKPGVCKYENRNGKSKTNKINKSNVIVITIIVAIIAFSVILFLWIHKNNTEYEVREYSLVELNDGVYGTLTQVSSRAPAYNYEMITLCCDGNVYTFKGNVEIQYTDSVKPSAKVHDYNIINSDKIWVYVPAGTIEFEKGVGVG